MNLRRLTRAGRRRAAVDNAVAAYSAWRCECAAVRAAYGKWKRAAASDARSAFAAYRAALDREERAAARYARLRSRYRPLPEIDVATQLAQLPAPFKAM